MSDAPTTLRALAAACEECLQAARNIPDNTACVHAQRLALMGALPDVTGWPATARELRSMADTVEALEAERDALRAEVARLRPLRALLEHCEAKGAVVSLSCVPDARLRWLLATGGDGVSFRATGDLDAVITAACDRLGVDHG